MEKRARSPSPQGDASTSPSKKRATGINTGNERRLAPSSGSFQFVDPNTGNIRQSFRFDDGSLVLKTSGDPPVLFQASKTMLSRQSAVFRGMFSLPQPDNAECIEGRPVVVVQDEPLDLQFFLSALHFYYEYFADTSTSWKQQSAVTAVLRLGTKYQVLHLRKKMVDYLSDTHYPTTIFKARLLRNKPFRNRFQDLRLVKEVGALCFLPAIYYLCASSTKLEEFLYPLDDGTKAEAYFCDENDKRICLRLREKLLGRGVSNLIKVVANNLSLDECTSPEICNREKLLWLSEVDGTPRSRTSPFGNTGQCNGDGGMCSTCDDECSDAHFRLEKILWDSLPSICGLDSWKSLQQSEEDPDLE